MANPRLKILFSALAGIVIFSGALLAYVIFESSKITLESLRNDGLFVYDDPIVVNEFSLTNHHDEPFNKNSLQNNWSLVFFGYTYCPDICPITLATIRQFYNLLDESDNKENVQVVMVSVDPERDTTEVLGNYVNYFDPDFIGATGEYSEIFRLTMNMNISFSYTRIDDENYLVNHNGEIMLLDPEGNNVGFFKAPHEPQFMLENFRAAKKYWASQR